MLGITMQLDISAMPNNNHLSSHENKYYLKKEKRKKIQKYGETRLKLIC